MNSLLKNKIEEITFSVILAKLVLLFVLRKAQMKQAEETQKIFRK